jgi:hypothetical protein
MKNKNRDIATELSIDTANPWASPLFATAFEAALWLWLLRTSDRGKVSTSRTKIAKAWCVTDHAVRVALERLKKTNLITSASTNSSTAIIICNYDHYSADGDAIRQQPRQPDNLPPLPPKTLYDAVIADQFEEWWALYPRREAKPVALKSFKKALAIDSYERIYNGTVDYVGYLRSRNTSREYTKLPATFLNQHSWRDDYRIEPPPRDPFQGGVSKADALVAGWPI